MRGCRRSYKASFLYRSEEDRRFFAEAMRDHTVDVIKRMKEISAVMNLPAEVVESQGITPEELEGKNSHLMFISIIEAFFESRLPRKRIASK